MLNAICLQITLRSLVAITVVATSTGIPSVHAQSSAAPAARVQVAGVNSPTFEAEPERNWSAYLSLDWSSKYVLEGVDILPNNNAGILAAELGVEFYGFSAAIWSASGLRQSYTEFDFIFGYTFDLGPLTLTPGYAFYVFGEPSAPSTSELTLLLEYNGLPFGLKPAINFYYDVDEVNGGFLELILAGEYGFFEERFTVMPYTLLGTDFGYVVPNSNEINNFQFGVGLAYQINDVVSMQGSVNQSIALNNLNNIGLGNVFWVSVGVVFTY